jgi:uncharacterized protein (DUF983 family)
MKVKQGAPAEDAQGGGVRETIVKRELPSIASLLVRCLRLRCPVCGKSTIAQRPFKIKHHCPSCDALFMREAGFFVGAILVNVVTTELVILAMYVVCLVIAGFDYRWVLTALFMTALLFPVAFYHHSWSVWLAFDHLVEGLPKDPSAGLAE